MRKSKFKQTMSMLLAVLMVFMSMNFSVFAEELTAPTDETTTTTVEAPAEQPAEEQTPAVGALTPVNEETGTTEENAVIQETPAMMALSDSEYLAPGTPALDEMTGKECFFANGTPITIEATTTEGKGAKITWDGGSQEVSSAANIFGGGHNHDGTYESTSVTMTGGTVNAVFGGGLHKSHVATANVVIKDGAVIGQIAGGAASSFSGTTCHQPWPGSDSPNAFVDTANATIEGGTIKGSALVYGGGEGMSQTGNTNLNITGGTFDKAYIIPGGSNGTTTGTAKVEISTDIKDSIVQGVNRGKTENIVIDIKTGAKVDKVYAGGETGDSNVTGTIEKATVNIAADSAVANLQPGTNGGIEIAPNSTELITLNYDDSAVINEGKNTLEKLETRFGAAVLGKTAKAIAVTDVEGKLLGGYDNLPDAVDAAPENAVVTLKAGIYNQNRSAEARSAGLIIQRKDGETGEVVVQKDKENEWSTGADNDGSVASLIDITADNVTLNNLIIQGAEKAGSGNGHGVNIVDSQNVHLNNITTKNNAASGLVVNSSEVFAHNLYTSDNSWYGINLDQNKDESGNPQGSAYFELTYDDGINPEDAITDATQIYADHGRNESYIIDASLPVQFKRYNSGSEAFLWSTREMDNGVYIEQDGKKVYYPTIQSAIDAAESGSTVYVGTGSFGTGTTNAPGTININKDITVEGQGNANSSILDKIEITANCTLNLNKIKIAPDYTERAAYDSIHMPASANGATVNLNNSIIEQKVSGIAADSSSTASNGIRIDASAAVEINLVDSQIKMNTGANAYNRAVQINGANSKLLLDHSTISNDTEGSAPYVWGVQVGSNTDNVTAIVKNESLINVTGFGLRSGDNKPDFTVENSKIICRGNRDVIEGQNIFYGGVALDFQTGRNGKLSIKNSEIIAGNIQDKTVRAMSFLSSSDSVVTITDSKISSTGEGIAVQNGSDNIKIDITNTSVIAENGNGLDLQSYNAQVNLKSGSSVTAKGSGAAGMYLSRNAQVNVDKSSTVSAPNGVGVYFENFYSAVNPDDNNNNAYNEAFYGDAQEAAFTLNGNLYAKTAVVQAKTCGSGKFGSGASGNKEKAGPIQINIGSTAKIYALDNGFEFNSAYESTGAAAIKADKNAKVYAPVLVVKGENAVTDISQLDTLKFYAVSDVFTYDQETEAITLKEAAIENQTSGEKYLSIQEAIDNAYNNDRIYVPAGVHSESIKLTKPVKLIGANEGISANDTARDGAGETILKGAITSDNTKTIRSTLIDGFTFTGSAYIHAEYWSGNLNRPKISNVVIQNNIFKDIDTTVSGKNNAAIHLNCGPGQEVDNVTIRDNQFKNITSSHEEGTEAAAFSTNCFSGNLIISNNVIDTTEGNAITITPHEGASNVKVSITNNTIKNWKNRAIRMDAVKGVIDINQNSMIPGEKTIAGPDTPQIIKITSSDAANAEYNYWGTENPTFKRNGDNPSVISGDMNPYPYYSASDMSEESLKNAPAIVYYKEGSEEKVRGMYGNIQEAVNAAKADDTIILNADEYLLEAPVQIDKALTIKAGTNAVPWVKAAQNQNAFTVTGDVTGSLSFDGVNITAQTAPTGNESPKGIDVQQKAIIGSLIYKNAEIKDMYYGILVSVNSSEAKAKIVNTLDINHAVFTDNLHKAVYVENANTVKVDSTTFTGDASTGTEYWPTRIALDINEKYNSYDSVSVTNCAFNNIQGTPGTPSQEGQVGYGAALAVKARNDGSYADPAASLKNVTITGNIFIGNTCDLMIGEPAAEGKVAEHTWNLGTVNIQKNAFSSKVQNNYKQKTDTSQNYWGSETPNFTALTAGLMEVYPYYTDAEMTKLYAPIELRSADGKEVKYFGTVKDAFAVANDSDTVVINKTSDGQPATVDEPIDMNVVSGSKLITVNLQLEGSTTFNKAFTGTTKGHMILSTGKNTDQPTIAIFNGSVDGFVSVDAVNFDSAKAPVIKALSSETDRNSFISKTGVLSVSEEGDYRIWTYGSPSENFNGGDGSEAKPYQINTADQLKLLAKDGFNTKKYFKLTNDIAVNDWTALAKFEGNFDGNGYSITGNNGSFIDALAAGAKVEKLRFEGFTNLVDTNNGTIENCYTLMGEIGAPIIGTNNATLSNSFSSGPALVTIAATGSIINSYYSSDISGENAKTKAEMQKAQFAVILNGNKTEGAWYYDSVTSAYPVLQQNGSTKPINEINVSVTPIVGETESIGYAAIVDKPDSIYENDSVQVKATVRESYKATHYFDGWYINDVKVSRDSEATIQVKADCTIEARFVEKAKSTLIVRPNGLGYVYLDGVKLNANTYVNERYVGTSVTVKAEARNVLNTTFNYWIDANTNQIIAMTPEYTFTVGSNRSIQAVFFTPEEDQCRVQFLDLVNNIMEEQSVEAGQTVTPPTAPTQPGYDFAGWLDTKTNEIVSKGDSFTVKADMTLKPTYTKSVVKYKLKVYNGRIGDTQNSEAEIEGMTSATVHAVKPADAGDFAGWKLADASGNPTGNYFSYTESTRVTVTTNLSVIAVYGEKPEERAVVYNEEPRIIQQSAGSNLSIIGFRGRVVLPEGYTRLESGMIYKQGIATADDLLITSPNVTQGMVSNVTGDGLFTKTIMNVEPGATYSARAYLIVQNRQGAVETVYSDIVNTVTATGEF